MNLIEIAAAISRFDEVEVVGRGIETEQGTADLIGFFREKNQIHCYVLQPSERDDCPVAGKKGAGKQAKTRRQEILSQQQPEISCPVGWVRSVAVGEETYSVSSGESGSAEECAQWMLLDAFLRWGYQPSQQLASRDLSYLTLSQYTLDGEFERLFSTAGRSIRLTLGAEAIQHCCHKRLHLSGEKAARRAFSLQDRWSGEVQRFYAERVYLMDLWAEAEASFQSPRFAALEEPLRSNIMRQHKAALEQLCPKGYLIPVLELEAAKKISLECYSSNWLDMPPDTGGKGGSVGLILRADPEKAVGRHGLPLRAAPVYGPVLPGTQEFEIEIVCWHEQFPEKALFFPVPGKKHLEVSAAILTNEADEILICQRGAGGNCAFLWEFPGGKREAGESFEDCLIRECREELEIEVLPQALYHRTDYDYAEFSVSLCFFQAAIESGSPKMDVHHAMRWVAKSELSHYEFCPADQDVVARLSEASR